MRIVNCPGCGADLEVPPSAGGGAVVCPFCETEFAPRGAPAPRRTRPGGRPRRGGRGYEAEVEDGGYGRGGYRRRTDPIPLLFAGIAVVVLAGLLIFFLSQGEKGSNRRSAATRAEIAAKAPAYHPPPKTLAVTGDPYRLFIDYVKGDRITFRRLDYNAMASYEDSTGRKEDLFSETYSIRGEITNETVVEKENGIATHEGVYSINSFLKGGREIVRSPVTVKARFRTDALGGLVPGSFGRLEGAMLAEWPALLGERGFGIVDGRSHRQGERWGLDRLPERVFDMVRIPGVDPRSIPAVEGGRQGGWFIRGGKPVKTAKGAWDKREAHLLLRLSAVENRRAQNASYNGRPADISVSVQWRGSATYELGKRMISNVEGLNVYLDVVIKTEDAWYEWIASENVDAQIFKDT